MSAGPTYSADLAAPIGTILEGKYRLDKTIGAGGMGVVVLGRHLGLNQNVAIKMLRPSAMHSPDVVARFAREARASTNIRSEHVARVLDVGTTAENVPFIVMEHLVGSDLSAISKTRGKLPPTEAIDYVLQACEALAEAHRLGIVHRDLKPANLFLAQRADGSPLIKVLDFGISKLQRGIESVSEDLTKSEVMMGSPHYMSPEQLASPKNVDARADIWALGAVLFRLVSGQTPFSGETAAALCALVLTAKPPRLSTLMPDVPPQLDEAVARCLQRNPAARFTTVSELAEALAPLATDDGRSSVRRIAGVISSPSLPSSSPSIPPPSQQPTRSEPQLAAVDAPPPAPSSSSWVAHPTPHPDPERSAHVTFGTTTLNPLRVVRKRSGWAIAIVAGTLCATLGVGILSRMIRPANHGVPSVVGLASPPVTNVPSSSSSTMPVAGSATAPEPTTPTTSSSIASATTTTTTATPARPPPRNNNGGVALAPKPPPPPPTTAAPAPSPAPSASPKPSGTSEYGGRK